MIHKPKLKGMQVLLGAGLCFAFICAILVYAHVFGPARDIAVTEHYIVAPNTSLYFIAEELERRELIVNAFAFQLAYNTVSGGSMISPGAYELSPRMDTWSVARAFSRPPQFAWVHIGVGLRAEQVRSVLRDALLWDNEDLAQFDALMTSSSTLKLDGFFIPGVYLLATKTPPQEAMAMFYDKAQQTYEDILAKARLTGVSMYDALTVASLIQKEAAGPHDMNLVSGIIWNRINKDAKLQIDATLQYAKGEEGDWWQVPLSEDKYINSPYNTYQHTGLPPGPISNASLAALAAAVNPQTTSCFFYLHDPFARIHCSPTYSGHISNINSHLR